MKNLKTLTLAMFLVGSTCTFAAGLSGGDQYSAQNIYGRLTLQCATPNGMTTVFTDCRRQILNPGEYAHFVGPQTDADHVTLRATREDGSVSKAKTAEYDGAEGKSKKTFNLWISTVLQRPLLNFGKNTVTYTLTKNGNKVEEGTFVVNVVDGGKAVCQRSGFYFSNLEDDCKFPSNYCPVYFNENNYCQ